MCMWLLTACLGLMPVAPPSGPIVIIQGPPGPILQPTPSPTSSPGNVTSFPPTGNNNVSFPPPMSSPPNIPLTSTTSSPTSSSTTAALTTSTNPPSMTSASTALPTSTNPPSMTSASTNAPLPTNAILLPVVICQNPSAVCVANPNIPSASGTLPTFGTVPPSPTFATVSPPIDPRQGTTPGPSSALQLPPITAYSGQLTSDTAVQFPRERRSIVNHTRLYEDPDEHKHTIRKRQSCLCVPAGTCPPGGTGNLGNGLIDIRIVTPNGAGSCGAGTEYCCVGGTGTPGPGTPIGCGIRQSSPATVITPASGQAAFGQYPWMVLILTQQNGYIGGGVLINRQNVLTVIHRIQPYIVGNTAPSVKVRLGEWDAAGTYEPVPFQEYSIRTVFTHPSYNSATLQYDVAVLRLTSPVPITPQAGAATTINRACLPSSATAVFNGQRCWVSGWGKDVFGAQGNFQQILKEVQVPIVDQASCQNSLRNARLGPSYVLDTTSFICAGGETQRDSCTGDGGSGLVCFVNGAWTVVGLVSWGLGCATAGVPGVYVNVAALLPWIQQQVAAP